MLRLFLPPGMPSLLLPNPSPALSLVLSSKAIAAPRRPDPLHPPLRASEVRNLRLPLEPKEQPSRAQHSRGGTPACHLFPRGPPQEHCQRPARGGDGSLDHLPAKPRMSAGRSPPGLCRDRDSGSPRRSGRWCFTVPRPSPGPPSRLLLSPAAQVQKQSAGQVESRASVPTGDVQSLPPA